MGLLGLAIYIWKQRVKMETAKTLAQATYNDNMTTKLSNMESSAKSAHAVIGEQIDNVNKSLDAAKAEHKDFRDKTEQNFKEVHKRITENKVEISKKL